jgi:hypothetical protein
MHVWFWRSLCTIFFVKVHLQRLVKHLTEGKRHVYMFCTYYFSYTKYYLLLHGYDIVCNCTYITQTFQQLSTAWSSFTEWSTYTTNIVDLRKCGWDLIHLRYKFLFYTLMTYIFKPYTHSTLVQTQLILKDVLTLSVQSSCQRKGFESPIFHVMRLQNIGHSNSQVDFTS